MKYAHFQAHLERIADYLYRGEGVWWHVEGDSVIMHDGPGSKIYLLLGIEGFYVLMKSSSIVSTLSL